MAFYKYRERDFYEIKANDLKRGDEIAYSFGGDIMYGAIPVEDITRVRGAGMLIQYVLPIGALAESSPTRRIAIYWNGSTPDIHMSQDLNSNDRIFIRKK